MRRDFTVIAREAVNGTANTVVKIRATNYAGDRLEIDIMANDEEQFQVYDLITVEVTARK